LRLLSEIRDLLTVRKKPHVVEGFPSRREVMYFGYLG
jgi:hypothetical protein